MTSRLTATPVLSLIAAAALSCPAAAAAPEFSTAFSSGTGAYASIRIPSALVTKAGTVLAFAEGRLKPQDQAENDIVVTRSTDGGKTWSPLTVLHDDGAHSLNNPTVVQDQESGRIFLWYQRIPGTSKSTAKAPPRDWKGRTFTAIFSSPPATTASRGARRRT